MAQVNFSNAVLTPPSAFMFNTGSFGIGANNNDAKKLWNSRGSSITSNFTVTIIINEQSRKVAQYQGTFSVSGTEFYFGDGASDATKKWKISNISFESGDTYNFQIPVNLICNNELITDDSLLDPPEDQNDVLIPG